MKKVLFIILILSISSQAFAAKKYIEKSFYEDGKLRYEAEVLEGVRNGILKVYFKSGALKTTAKFNKGVLEGIASFYAEDGNRLMQLNYYNNEIEGMVKNEEGVKEADIALKKDICEGSFQEYSVKGVLKAEGIYKACKKIYSNKKY